MEICPLFSAEYEPYGFFDQVAFHDDRTLEQEIGTFDRFTVWQFVRLRDFEGASTTISMRMEGVIRENGG
jgi:hypothetical protein